MFLFSLIEIRLQIWYIYKKRQFEGKIQKRGYVVKIHMLRNIPSPFTGRGVVFRGIRVYPCRPNKLVNIFMDIPT